MISDSAAVVMVMALIALGAFAQWLLRYRSPLLLPKIYLAASLCYSVWAVALLVMKFTPAEDISAIMLRDLKLSKAETVVAVPLMVEAVYGMLMKSAGESEDTAEAETILKKNRFWGRFGLSRGQEALYKIKEAAGLGRLNQCVVGGANMSRELCEDLGLFGISVLQGYGITECSPLISVNTLDSCRMLESSRFKENSSWIFCRR